MSVGIHMDRQSRKDSEQSWDEEQVTKNTTFPIKGFKAEAA